MAVKGKQIASTAAIAASKPRNKTESHRLWSVLLGDALVFIIFAVIGRQSHGEDTGLTAALRVIWTALPFALAWFLIAPFMGAFRRELMIEPRPMAKKTALAWVAAWPVGVFLHFVFEQHVPTVSTTVSFGLVTLLSNLVLLFVWRIPFVFTNRAKEQQGPVSYKRKKK
ncbi:DUF3054 domain-containing protein [Dictyobacter arantiisoli]|uniref:DUF3054 domain-containing protein n=1 Tax=Dictyobacter arantiisoli TaxID=2014874 RepID=A0A5A5TAA2_9CHLR|nr:DUF3054 domain-containing protein [Dictyobacter arantiisoli]GCF08328.1 hypothetical protein KDI_18920 [Dictyobacter arantiisoli]